MSYEPYREANAVGASLGPVQAAEQAAFVIVLELLYAAEDVVKTEWDAAHKPAHRSASEFTHAIAEAHAAFSKMRWLASQTLSQPDSAALDAACADVQRRTAEALRKEETHEA